MMSDETELDPFDPARALLRVSRLRRLILIGTCTAAILLIVLAGGALLRWWPLRAWMIAALLIPVVLVLLAAFSLKAPESVRKRLWVRRAVLIVPHLLLLSLLAWGGSDIIGYGPGFTGGLGGGVGVFVADVIRKWPRRPDVTAP